MPPSDPRLCPLCSEHSGDLVFPYATSFNKIRFGYKKCIKCSTVFVDPVPDLQTFGMMYAKTAYHDCHYEDIDYSAYVNSANLLRRNLPSEAFVLDYGCGVGTFLKALKSEGFLPYGVEFDRDAARVAGRNAGCEVLSVTEFFDLSIKPSFDVIHLGDVLEHLPDPAATLTQLLDYLRPGGMLFVQGPLEINPSPVYWAARVFGSIKRMVRPGLTPCNAPTHLFRTNEKAQLEFFKHNKFKLSPIFWRVYETGWPYASGGVTKRCIASLAVMLGGIKIFGVTFGNRFEGLFVKERNISQ